MKTTKIAIVFYTVMALALGLWLFVYLKSPSPAPVTRVTDATQAERQAAQDAALQLIRTDNGKNNYSAYVQNMTDCLVLPKVSLNQVDFAAGGAVSDGYGNVRGFRLCGKTAQGRGFYLDLSRGTDGNYTVSAVAEDDRILPAVERDCSVLFLFGQRLYAATESGEVYPASQWADDLFTEEPPMTLEQFNAALISSAREADFWFGHILSPGGAVRTLVYLGVLAVGTLLLAAGRRVEKRKRRRPRRDNVISFH